jgi:hypothetical protein
MAIGERIAEQIHAQMLLQTPDAFRPFFEMQSKPAPPSPERSADSRKGGSHMKNDEAGPNYVIAGAFEILVC